MGEYCKSETDARVLVEAVVAGALQSVGQSQVKPPHSIRSGTIVVFVEQEKGSAKHRWRDGFHWSPAKAQSPFLLYREIEPANANMKYSEKFNRIHALFHISNLRDGTQLVSNGLAKRTISILGSNGIKYRVISYFKLPEIINFHRKAHLPSCGGLKLPSDIPEYAQYAVIPLTKQDSGNNCQQTDTIFTKPVEYEIVNPNAQAEDMTPLLLPPSMISTRFSVEWTLNVLENL
ncbi:hypothetical protein HK100_010742 [Physocladia obscura]|uniref:Uncharacterized protein n=1 Tax=Physocladia obscura TaxID=109957 RepID=A0AAD5T219_9FUNG|nr:hypothetical protein HK100_010742 [Physocladia obscura]